MRIVLILLAACCLPVAGIAADSDGAIDAQLIRMETSKWDPSALRNPVDLMAMFSREMLSVDYGAELHGGVERRTWKDIIAYGPLPAWKMNLSEWRAVHASPDVVVLSYKVTGETVEWKAYATSVWARRDGKWQTIFYQASTAK